MYRWRRNVQYPKINTYQELQETLDSENWLFCRSHELGSIKTAYVKDLEDATVAMIMFDKEFILSLDAVTSLHITGTRRVIPQLDDTQLTLCVIAEYRGYVSNPHVSYYQIRTYNNCHPFQAFPLAWILIKDQTLNIFRAVIDFIQHELAPSIQPQKIYTDFQLSSAVAWKFPDSEINITFHDFCRVSK